MYCVVVMQGLEQDDEGEFIGMFGNEFISNLKTNVDEFLTHLFNGA